VSGTRQAKALGLCRSTTWTLVKGCHKASGLSARLIKRMLASPELPPPVRERIHEYVRERLEGVYGHNKMQLRKFAWRLSGKHIPTAEEVIGKARADRTRRTKI
jgi:hypothetical protein